MSWTTDVSSAVRDYRNGLIDEKGSSDGVWVGGTGSTSVGKFGGTSLVFDGSKAVNTSLVDIAGSTELSIEYWYKSTSANAGAHGSYPGGSSENAFFIQHNRGSSLPDSNKFLLLSRVKSGGSDERIYTTSAVSGANDGNWHHMLFVVNLNTDISKIYVDGALQASTEVSNCIASSFSSNFLYPIYIGALNTANVAGSFFTGEISHFRFYKSDKSANISSLYAGPEPTNTSPPTLDSEGNWSAGTWDSHSNGEITYSVKVIKDTIEIAVLSGESGTIDFTSIGDYSILVSASNSGGNDSNQDLSSNVYEYTGELDDLENPISNISFDYPEYTTNNIIAIFQDEYTYSAISVSSVKAMKSANRVMVNRDLDKYITRYKKRQFE